MAEPHASVTTLVPAATSAFGGTSLFAPWLVFLSKLEPLSVFAAVAGAGLYVYHIRELTPWRAFFAFILGVVASLSANIALNDALGLPGKTLALTSLGLAALIVPMSKFAIDNSDALVRSILKRATRFFGGGNKEPGE